MAMHPNMMAYLAKEHQRDLLREADHERLIQQASRERSGAGIRLLQRVSVALVALGHALEPHQRSTVGMPEGAPTLASNDIQL